MTGNIKSNWGFSKVIIKFNRAPAGDIILLRAPCSSVPSICPVDQKHTYGTERMGEVLLFVLQPQGYPLDVVLAVDDCPALGKEAHDVPKTRAI